MLTMVGRSSEFHETDDLPDKNVARDFYAKYEPKEVLGKYGFISLCFHHLFMFSFCFLQGCIEHRSSMYRKGDWI